MRAALRIVFLVSFSLLLPVAARAQANPAARTGDAVGFDIAWDHVALSVPNIAETIAWYEKMLGFKGTVRGGQPGARQQVADLRRGNITIELFQLPDAAPLPESRKNPSEDFRTHGVKHFGFEVRNLPAVLAELKAKGVKMAFEMRDTPTTAFAFISDNAGNAIELIEHKGDSDNPQTTPAEIQTFEAFRAWLGQQPANVQQAGPDDVLRRYAEELRRQGKTDTEIPATIASLRSVGDRAEIERWNRILTAPNPTFNTEPNAFLVAVTRGLKPGRSLDVGMGQGRNTIFLAQQGWDSHGFDPAERAVAAAQEQARKAGVKITTAVTRAEEFDWGAEQWDLIVLSYVGARGYVANVAKALRRGGMVIVEGFHRDATKEQPIGGGVVFDSGELQKLFADFRIVRYEEPIARSDFGRLETKVVRLAGVKP